MLGRDGDRVLNDGRLVRQGGAAMARAELLAYAMATLADALA
ncbi:MAG: hypothetical protein ACR2O6_09640 [Ilumatobacteraceae bacterium]